MLPTKVVLWMSSDVVDYLTAPFQSTTSFLFKSQHLLLNLGYLLGVQPLRFDSRTGELLPLKTKWEKLRWSFAAPIGLLVKLMIVLSFGRDHSRGEIDYSSNVALIRLINVAISLSSLTFDAHMLSYLTETLALNNSVCNYYQTLTAEYFHRPAKSSRLIRKWGHLLLWLYSIFPLGVLVRLILFLKNCKTHILESVLPVCSRTTDDGSSFTHGALIWLPVWSFVQALGTLMFSTPGMFIAAIGFPAVVRIMDIVYEVADVRASPESELRSVSSGAFVLLFKSDYIVGVILNNYQSDVLMPIGCGLSLLVSVACNYIVIRLDGFLVRVAAGTLGLFTLITIFLALSLHAKLALLREKTLAERKKRAHQSRLMSRLLKGCRVCRSSFGNLYYVDYAFITVLAANVINYTATILIAL